MLREGKRGFDGRLITDTDTDTYQAMQMVQGFEVGDKATAVLVVDVDMPVLEAGEDAFARGEVDGTNCVHGVSV